MAAQANKMELTAAEAAKLDGAQRKAVDEFEPREADDERRRVRGQVD